MPGLPVADQLERVVAALPGGQVRIGQRAMAEAVARCLATNKEDSSGGPSHLAVTAGTGTGKSFAYLVPAVVSGKRVVVATATKALQDQLATKDMPVVGASLLIGRPVRWAVLKGRSNYLCRQRLVEMEAAGRQATLEGVGEGRQGRRGRLGAQVAKLVEWAETTASGDRAELSFEPQPAAWSAVSVSADECPGAHRCPSGADCFMERARAKAAQSDVVIVNLHLLGADLRSGGSVLPEHDAVVVDEAHELEDVLAACLGVDVSPGRLRGIAAGARSALRSGEPVDAVLAAAVRYEQALEGAADRRLPPGLGGEIGPAANLAVVRLGDLERALRKEADPASAGGGQAGGGTGQAGLRTLLAVERCREELESCLVADGCAEVVWVAGGDRPSLRSAPLEVSGVLSQQLFAEVPVVLTSATLPLGLGQRLGAAPARLEELDVGSPFDYRSHGLLYCATRLPDRRRPGAEAALQDELENLVHAAGGRTLALFTSYRAMEAAATALRPRIPWPIHVQGESPKTALLQAFSTEEESCLFATMGFWQGVDVPGPALSLVVIDRLPFPRPDEPLLQARREAAGALGFRLVDLPRAASLLAQGAGRLIRSETDRGVVAVLDPRLATASYSGYLVKSLPPMRRTRERAEAVAFLESMHAASVGEPA